MTLSHDALQRTVAAPRRRWLVTGAAGFIGSHLVEALLALGQDVANAVQANLRVALTTDAAALNQVYNVAVGERMTLNGLGERLAALVREKNPELMISRPVHEAFRAGDVRHSQADIGKGERLLGYAPTHDLRAGLQAALPWYLARYAPAHEEANHAA